MDPQATWERMLKAWKGYDWVELLEAATDLRHWMAEGGFPPEIISGHNMGPLWNRALLRAACEFAVRISWQVLNSPNGIPNGIQFSLSCFDCDADSPASYDEAILAGWTGIEFRPDLPMENFLGYCSEHVPEPPWETDEKSNPVVQ